MLGLGFIEDDMLMSTLGGKLGLLHLSVWTEISEQILQWMQNEGRFFPAPFVYSDLFFALSPSMLTEKIVQLAVVLLNVATLF